MTNLESRVVRLEMAAKAAEESVRRLQGQVVALQQAARLLQAQAAGYGGGSGGGGTGYWCQSPGFVAATGSWPSLTPSVATGVTVYVDQGGTLTSYATNQTIRWWYKDASTAGKLVAIVRAADGSAWDALLDSCSGV